MVLQPCSELPQAAILEGNKHADKCAGHQTLQSVQVKRHIDRGGLPSTIVAEQCQDLTFKHGHVQAFHSHLPNIRDIFSFGFGFGERRTEVL